MSPTKTAALCLAVAALTAVLTGCSSDSTTTTARETTSSTSTTSAAENAAATARFDKTVQQELADVGCYKGAVDGIIGPKTDAAIVEFQSAAGLEVDGELGPETEAALTKAAAEGETVCTSTTTTTAPATTTTAAGGTAPCTATALLQGLPADGEGIQTYLCTEGYAAGTLSDGTTKFILKSSNGAWVALTQDPCDSASAGLPPIILQDGCSA